MVIVQMSDASYDYMLRYEIFTIKILIVLKERIENRANEIGT